MQSQMILLTGSGLELKTIRHHLQYGESYSLQSTALSIVLKPGPIPMSTEIRYSLRGGRGGSLDFMWDVQTHSGPLVFLVTFHKYLARMNGTPQPNQK